MIVTWKKVYKVQVEYWYWDSESYYWADYYQSTNYDAANFVYVFVNFAKQMGNLNQVAPHTNWMFIPVDVRLVVQMQPVYLPKYLSPEQQSIPTFDSPIRLSMEDD